MTDPQGKHPKQHAWRCADCNHFHQHATPSCRVSGRPRAVAEDVRTLDPPLAFVDEETVLTAIVREADEVFQRVGGSSRHWVRDCFLPLLQQRGWTIQPSALLIAQAAHLERVHQEHDALKKENQELRTRVAPPVDCVAPAGSTAEPSRGAVTAAERTDNGWEDDDDFDPDETTDLCADCGRPIADEDVCGVCGRGMCFCCFEVGAGVCRGPHK